MKSYGEDGMAAVHPDDVEQLNAELSDFMASGEEQREFTYRIKGRWGIYLIKNIDFHAPGGGGAR